MAFIAKDILKKIQRNDDLIRLKEELEKSFAQFKENIIYGQQLASIGSWTHDIKRDQIFLSDEVYNILGCSPREFDGKLENYYLYIHPDDLEEVREATQGALEGKEYDIEYRIVTNSGKVKYVHEKTKVLLDEDKAPAKMIGIMQDITKHKIIENDLKALGENLNQAQRVAGVGSWKYDVYEDKIFWSEEVYRIHGIDPLGFKKDYSSFIKLLHPEDQIEIQKAVERCLAGKAYEIEYRIPQSDGTEKFVIGRGTPLFGEEQQVVGIIGTVQDITEKKLLEEQLKKNYEDLAKSQALAHIGSWKLDIARNKSDWSEEAYRIYGITPDQYDGTYEGFLKFVHPDDVEIIHGVLENPLKEQYLKLEFRIIRPDGSVRNMYQLVEIIFDKDGNSTYLYGTTQDITEKKELQKKLEQTQEAINKIQRRFQVLVQESSDVFEIISPDGTIQYISPAVEKFTGYKPEERIGRSAFEFVEEKEKPKMMKMLEYSLNNPNETVKGDIIVEINSEKKMYLELSMSNQLAEPSIHGIVINWRDITKRIEMERNIEYIATHDELTGLPNSVYFKKEIKIQCQRAKGKQTTFALMMLDIDGFKRINDALGYEIGDQLIVQVSKKLKNYLDNKRFICRYSGDQFAIIIPGLSTIEEYNGIAREIMDVFIYPFNIDLYELYITMSMGISIYPEDGQDYDSLMKHSNIALLQAKNDGKNKYKFYSSNMDINNYKQLMLRNDLHKAIEKGQVKVYYQPQVNLKTNEILGAEALIRWEHPAWGLVTPDEFISLAEESGYIINLGHWLLREVCCNFRKWLDNGLFSIKVSVNYSSIQFFEKDFIENIKNTISEFQLNPDFLIIEITESVLMNKSEQVIEHIKSLQALGIQVALDDFGTGFSSLAYLSTFNIDVLKIDRSFIKSVPFDETSNIITRSMIDLARDLRVKLVAEGIENWDQLSYLRKLNCFAGQGFLYSRPLPGKEFEGILAGKKCKPVRANDAKIIIEEERRRFFRINFAQLLEADMTILQIKGKSANVGNTKVVIKDIGPGGLCFVSNIKLPVRRDIILQFITELLGKEIKVYGCPVWAEEVEGNLHEYGMEFTFDENERMALTRVLNQLQVKMRNNLGFAGGRFVSDTAIGYFKVNNGDN